MGYRLFYLNTNVCHMTRISPSKLEDILLTMLSLRITDRKFYIRAGEYEVFKFDPVARKITLRHPISCDYDTVLIDDYPHVFTTEDAIIMYSECEYSKYESGQYAECQRFTFIKKASVDEVMEYCNNLSTTTSNN